MRGGGEHAAGEPHVAAHPTASATGAPSISGATLTLTAPDPVVQSCAITVTAVVAPVDPGNPLVSALLDVTSAGGGTLFSGPPTLLDSVGGLATWSLARETTEAWPAGAILFSATATLASGEIVAVEVGSEVVEMNTLVMEIDGKPYQDGETVEVSCALTPPVPIPSTPIGGYSTPGGGFTPCGPVLTSGGILPPNLNAAGQTVLTLSSSPATSFTITLENPGTAQVQFTSPLVKGVTTTVTVAKQAPACALKVLSVWFNHIEKAHRDDAMELVVDGDGNYDVNRFAPEWTNLGASDDEQDACKPVPIVKRSPTPLANAEDVARHPWACYSLEDIKKGKLEIMARFHGTPKQTFKVWAEEILDEHGPYPKLDVTAPPFPIVAEKVLVFADVAALEFTADKDGCPKPNPDTYVKLGLEKLKFPERGIAYERVRLQWRAICKVGVDQWSDPFDVGLTEFDLLVVRDSPRPFWNAATHATTQTPWIQALRYACLAAARRTLSGETVEDVLRSIYHQLKFRYDFASSQGGAQPSADRLWEGLEDTSIGSLNRLRGKSIEPLPPDTAIVTQGIVVRPPEGEGRFGSWEFLAKPDRWRLKRFDNDDDVYPGSTAVAPSMSPPFTVGEGGKLVPAVVFNLSRLVREQLLAVASRPPKSPSQRKVICSDVAGALQVVSALLGCDVRLACAAPIGYLAGGLKDAGEPEPNEIIGGVRCNNPIFEAKPSPKTGARPGIEKYPDLLSEFAAPNLGSRRLKRALAPAVQDRILARSAVFETTEGAKAPYYTHMWVAEGPADGQTYYDAMFRIGADRYVAGLSLGAYYDTVLESGGVDGPYVQDVLLDGHRRTNTVQVTVPRFR